MNTESVQYHPLFEIACWAHTSRYRGHNLH